MRRLRLMGIMALASIPAAAVAADADTPRIIVSGTASVSTPPDLAIIDYGVQGEGATSDAAVQALVARRKRIDDGLATFARSAQPKASQVSIVEVRAPECQNGYGPRLSTGACAIIGYVANIGMSIRTPDVKQAGTIVGLIGRLDGTSPRIRNFALADPASAQDRAIAAALADARTKAQAIAKGANVRLGALISASNSGMGGPRPQDMMVTVRAPAPPPPPPPPPPIDIDLTPQTIETQAQMFVTYALLP